MDAVALARCFGLGGAARLSDGPVARGKQGLVWRLETAEASWAVKVPFHRSGEDEVRSATAFQEAAGLSRVLPHPLRDAAVTWVARQMLKPCLISPARDRGV